MTDYAAAMQRALFLSYSGTDRDLVVRLRDVLSSRGVGTFYDRDDLTPGRPWFDELEAALHQVRGLAVCIGAAGLGTIQKREMQIGLVRQASEEQHGRSFPVVPVLLEGADPEQVSGFLALNTWVDLRGGLHNAQVDHLVRATRDARSIESSTSSTEICPYRSLNAFREEDAALFFGREAFALKVLNKLLERNLVAVIGRSGSGKSSAVQAGLLPLLRRQRPPADTWEVVTFTPGIKPFDRLAARLVPLWSTVQRDRTDVRSESETLIPLTLQAVVPKGLTNPTFGATVASIIIIF